jgi:hypothetical protein
MYCDFFAITKRLTSTCKFELVKWENNNGRTKLGGEAFTKSHAESLLYIIYVFAKETMGPFLTSLVLDSSQKFTPGFIKKN